MEIYKNIVYNDMRKHFLNIWGKNMNKVEERGRRP